MPHLDEGTLHGLLDGEIPSSELGPIQAHLASCAECRDRLEAERALTREAMELVELVQVPGDGLTARRPGPAPANRSPWRGLAWAATVAGAVGLGYAARAMQHAPTLAPPATIQALRDDASGPAPATPAPQPAGAPARNAPPVAAPVPQARGGEERPAPPLAEAKSLAAEPDAARSRRDETSAAAAPAQGLSRQESGGVAAMKLEAAPPQPISFPDALQRLNGSIRLIPGLIPRRLEAEGRVVRVVYPLAEGELILTQELVDGKLVYQLLAPPGFPADSLERLRIRVRE